MVLLIGCSGWSYKDWVGPFYPKEVDQKEWLAYYGRYFPTVEINSTFYAVPNRYTVEAWIRKGKEIRRKRCDGPSAPGKGEGGGFNFSVKIPQSVTHEHLVKGDLDEALKGTRAFEEAVIDPLDGFDLMGALLVQLSPYFRLDRKDGDRNMRSLSGLFQALDLDRYDCAVEFRHNSWTQEMKGGKGSRELVPKVSKLLEEHRVALCETDGPGFPDLNRKGARRLYIRFHGRNRDLWYKKGTGSSKGIGPEEGEFDKGGRFNRYDYLYTEDELEGWSRRLRSVLDDEGSNGDVSYVYFNNHPRGKGPKNALMMMDLLGMAHEPKDVRLTSQQQLF